MNKIAIPSACRILPGSPSRDDFLGRLVDGLASSAGCPAVDPRRALEAVIARESSASTAFGLGIAIPHCFLADVGEPRLAVGVAPGGVAFDPSGGRLTYVVFLLVEDLTRRGAHTELLSRIARLCRETSVVRRLREAREATAIPGILAEAESAQD